MFMKKNALSMMVIILILSLITMSSCTTKDDNSGQSGGTSVVVPDDQSFLLPVYYVKTSENDTYLVREERLVSNTGDVYMTALEELINGKPATNGAECVLPEDTRIRNISIANGEMVIDFSSEVLLANVGSKAEELGIQSIVNTMTEFSVVDRVSFLVEGTTDEPVMSWWGHVGLFEQPFKRDLSMVYEPVIWVNHPVPGQEITSPLLIHGSAMVFEGTVCVRLLDASGKELTSGFTTAEAGAPERGDYNLPLEFAPATGNGKLEVYCEDTQDGKVRDLVSIPITFK